MLILSIESSTSRASIALCENSNVLVEKISTNPKAHSEFLNPAIESALQEINKKFSDLDLFAVDVGPGSFTGVRVAVNIVKTFSYLLQKPVFSTNSLEVLHAQSSELSAQNCLTMINAYKNMIYFSLFTSADTKTEPAVISAHDLESKIQDLGLKNPLICLGDGYTTYSEIFSDKFKSQLIRKSELSDFPSASTLAQKAHREHQNGASTLDWKSIIPLYLRASAAEENLQAQ